VSLVLLILFALVTSSCGAGSRITLEALAPLPEPVSNNAVTLVATDESVRIYSFLGLGSQKTHKDISRRAFSWDSETGEWTRLPDVPVKKGRLASAAVTVAGRIFLFGGYTVADDGSELSTPEVFTLREDGEFQHISNMPIPVDDAVALVYMNRYVYLISGWHDVGNVNLVQVFDSLENTWQQAEPWPGAAVFGHAGGISGRNMVICDGVRVAYPVEAGPRQFLPSSECWLGEVNKSDVRRIAWRKLTAHPGASRYRMAASGAEGKIVFVGGSENPYNFDGMGYNGSASEPIARIFSYEVESGEWQCHGQASIATMDHRALVSHNGWFYLAGGMLAHQEVSNKLLRFKLPAEHQRCQE
jgi:N-acetylneuraminic acid mutarotase